MTNSIDPDQLSDLDLHCLQRQGISRFSRTRVNKKKETAIDCRKKSFLETTMLNDE